MRRRSITFLAITLILGGVLKAQTTLFFENFDNLTAGQYVHTQQPLFFPWTGAAAEKAYVSNAQSHSPSNSMKIVNNNDMVFSFGSKTSGIYQVNFWMFVESTKGAYFNVEHAFGDSWAFSFYFKPGGTCDIKEGGITHTFNYNLDTWFPVQLLFNLDADSVYATVDGNPVAQWIFSHEENGTNGTKKLDVINFYGLNAASTGVPASSYYVDDFEYIQILAGVTPPTISINTTPITTSQTTNKTLTFSNTGEEPLNFMAYAVFQNPSVNSNLTAGQMRYDSGSLSAIGWQSSFEVFAATRFLPNKVKNYIGQNIVGVNIFIYEPPVGDSIRVYVWKKGGFDVPGTSVILAEKAFSVFAQMDNNITLDTPVPITGDEIWIGYKFTAPANGFTLGTDTMPLTPKTCYLRTGPVWSEFTGVGGNAKGNFAIRANVDGPGWPVWLNVSPFSGTVAPSGSQNLTLSFNTAGLTTGTYEADVVVGCNDLTSEWNTVHVTLTYTASGINEVPSVGIMTYPNPVTNAFNIISDNIITNVTVYSVDGRLVQNYRPETKETVIDLTTLSKGNYIVEISCGNTKTTRTIVKE